MRINTFIKQALLLFLFFSALITSCTDPQVIGLEIQPEGDRILISSYDNNSPFIPSTQKVDSVRSSQTLYSLLGFVESSNFLDAKAKFSTELHLSDNSVDFGLNPVLDSAILTLAYAGYYGDTTVELTLKIEELNEEIKDTSYYSNDVLSATSFSSQLIQSFYPTPNTLKYINSDTVELRGVSFNVDQIGQLILDAPTQSLVDNDAFIAYFKGLQFSVIDNQESASILYFNLIEGGSKLTIYYNDSLSYDLISSAACKRVNHFEMQEEFNVQNILGVQSMAGLELILEFDNLQFLRDTLHNKVINQATINFTKENSSDLYPAHSSLSLVRLDSSGNRFFLEDVLEGLNHFGGQLESNHYNFNITKFFQSLIQGENQSNTLILVPAGESVNANRTEINNNIELNIIYTNY